MDYSGQACGKWFEGIVKKCERGFAFFFILECEMREKEE